MVSLFSKIRRLTGIFCIIIMCTMAGMVLSDLVKSEYNYSIVPSSYPPTRVKTTGGFYSHSLIIVGAGKAELDIRLITSNETVVHEYDKISVSALGTILDKRVSLWIPALKPGIYKIEGILYYSANLIMKSKIYINMGTIVVEE